MANTQALCSQFKVDVLNGVHNFGTGVTRATAAADTFKAALYSTTVATLNASTTCYTTTGEVTASGDYTAGGRTVAWTPAAQSTPAGTANASSTAYATLDGSIVCTGFTALNFNAVLIYNNTDAAKRAVSVHTFGDQSITSGTFTLTMPTNNDVTGLVRLN